MGNRVDVYGVMSGLADRHRQSAPPQAVSPTAGGYQRSDELTASTVP